MPKNNYDKLVTPIGVSQYAWLTKPDTQFDPDGHYKVNLILDTAVSLMGEGWILQTRFTNTTTSSDSN